MKIESQSKSFATAVAAAIIFSSATAAFAARLPVPFNATAVANSAEIAAIERAANGRLLAIGRVDRISKTDSAVSVLGQNFVLLASPGNAKFLSGTQVGRPVALFGELSAGRYLVDAAMNLDGQYVQGASKVYLRGAIDAVDRKLGLFTFGAVVLDTSAFATRNVVDRFTKGATAAVTGTQPVIGGRILVEVIRKASFDASVGTGRADASVGTGRTDASLGTGRQDASLGTGRTDASLGTGRVDASVGTGRTDASVGTGKPDASLGTGRVDASVGTGRAEASLGTGRTDASVGTGKPEASLGTGRVEASLGTGRTEASLGTGRTNASVGTGKSDASVGTGRVEASLGTGRTEASLGTGRPDASVGTGRANASVGTGSSAT